MIIGHEAQMKFLRRSFAKETMAHAYLFVGSIGAGKKRAAEEVAGWLLGRKVEIKEGGTDFNVFFLDRGYDPKSGKKRKEISIEDIHRLRDYFNHHSLLGSPQVAIIDEADYLSRSASNALLKTLEEPRSGRGALILLASDENNLLSTVKSRCQIIRFNPVSTKEIYDGLTKRGVARPQALLAARLSANCPEAAVRFSQDEDVKSFYQTETERFFSLQKGTLAERFQIVEGLFKEKEDHIEARDALIKILELWQVFWRDFLLARQEGMDELVKNINWLEKIKAGAKHYSLSKLVELIGRTQEAVKELRQNIHPRLIMENLILSFYYQS
ncbi:MAG: AAA family ATPase [Candidatus Magasanikbacteria bacterium]|nr:AAA family ATPase [Candidatus Magasanikbacteria bacterium]